MRRQILPAIAVLLALSALLGLAYPLVVWGFAQVAFKDKADGSFVSVDGKTVASSRLGQNFLDAKGNPLRQYFQPRPSSAGTGYDALASAASNLGPNDDRLIAKCLPVQVTDKAGDPEVDSKGNPVYETNPDGSKVCSPNTVPQRAMAYRKLNGLTAATPVPVDAVTGSFSGLDPDISVANARLQAARVARARSIPESRVDQLITENTDHRALGFLGEDSVNVVMLNIALDKLTR
jgi:potassium-transporting ATPase KdpC subunit